MTAMGTDFMPLERQLFRLGLGEVLGAMARQKYPTAKHIAKAWGIDPNTASNLLKGHLSVSTLIKAVEVEGWGLWEALGASLTGESYADYEERQLQQVIEQAGHAAENLIRLRARREALAERSGELDRTWDRPRAERRG